MVDASLFQRRTPVIEKKKSKDQSSSPRFNSKQAIADQQKYIAMLEGRIMVQDTMIAEIKCTQAEQKFQIGEFTDLDKGDLTTAVECWMSAWRKNARNYPNGKTAREMKRMKKLMEKLE